MSASSRYFLSQIFCVLAINEHSNQIDHRTVGIHLIMESRKKTSPQGETPQGVAGQWRLNR